MIFQLFPKWKTKHYFSFFITWKEKWNNILRQNNLRIVIGDIILNIWIGSEGMGSLLYRCLSTKKLHTYFSIMTNSRIGKEQISLWSSINLKTKYDWVRTINRFIYFIYLDRFRIFSKFIKWSTQWNPASTHIILFINIKQRKRVLFAYQTKNTSLLPARIQIKNILLLILIESSKKYIFKIILRIQLLIGN